MTKGRLNSKPGSTRN